MTIRVKITDEMEQATAAATADCLANKLTVNRVFSKWSSCLVSFDIDGFITWQTKLTVNPEQH